MSRHAQHMQQALKNAERNKKKRGQLISHPDDDMINPGIYLVVVFRPQDYCFASASASASTSISCLLSLVSFLIAWFLVTPQLFASHRPLLNFFYVLFFLFLL
ncbi:hypothetical protein BDV32DRAFT_38061 [Aspergillus pseudonomiae]|uniref:Uncharacterized protein n=1 Tax=Aspergillus pseudonomiae TaxID=1506151 RepID=A0A5N6I5B7_9EURO|nr:uncharacterized protein BDV37DRAFT_264154 [Aspergillus pseudonomiae]KAB8261568.1 hypothetical protein BDV32DRAFT_38061 [Aspergillus pseudonomiae]KAE8398094.1 hypothetical protein BDV37DRAFT_264154 [Aspergillus pseudonomiae]